MLTIRFSRTGRKNRAQFRIVLQENTVAPTGKHIALLGSYDPHLKVSVLKADEIKGWISKGAQCSTSVFNLLVREGIVEGKKRAVKMPKPAVKEEVKTEETKVSAVAEVVADKEEKAVETEEKKEEAVETEEKKEKVAQ